jgi:heme iron utilization protein
MAIKHKGGCAGNRTRTYREEPPLSRDDAPLQDDPGSTREPASPPDSFDGAALAKRLLRTIRSGTLATLDRESGHPFASLTSIASDIDGSPIFLMSTLSAHRANVEADPRVSLILAQQGKGDPLAHPRLTVIGRAVASDAPRVRDRFIARHPKAKLYAGFADFAFFRLDVEGGHLNGGFARAMRPARDDLILDLAGCEALVEAHDGALAHMNEDHREALALCATKLAGEREGDWRATGIDPEGIDLALGDLSTRVLFPERVSGPEALRAALVLLAKEARAIGRS